jgi:hypothetical protein
LIKSNYVEETKKEIITSNMCFRCNFWTKRSNELLITEKTILIVENNWYTVLPDAPKNAYFKGCGGREIIFQILKDKKIIISKNVWDGGEIPVHFRNLIPNNAIFYNQIMN